MKLIDYFVIYFFTYMISSHLMLIMLQHYFIGAGGVWLFWSLFNIYCNWRATNAT